MRSFETLMFAAALAGATPLTAQGPPAPPVPHNNNADGQCTGGSAGGSWFSDRVFGAFATSHDSDGTHLDAAMLVRGEPGWHEHGAGRRASWPPSLPLRADDKQPQLAGASVDTLVLVFDRANDIAWMGGRRVELHGANVVLLDHVDGVSGPPEVVSILRIDPRIGQPFAGCGRPKPNGEDAIRETLMSSPVVRAFMMP